MAVLSASTNCHMHSNAVIAGEKGVIQVSYQNFPIFSIILKRTFKIPEFAWCPTKLILPNGELFQTNLPESEKTNFFNSVGLRYEADEARKAILHGKPA